MPSEFEKQQRVQLFLFGLYLIRWPALIIAAVTVLFLAIKFWPR